MMELSAKLNNKIKPLTISTKKTLITDFWQLPKCGSSKCNEKAKLSKKEGKKFYLSRRQADVALKYFSENSTCIIKSVQRD